jgi:hypothetical protein
MAKHPMNDPEFLRGLIAVLVSKLGGTVEIEEPEFQTHKPCRVAMGKGKILFTTLTLKELQAMGIPEDGNIHSQTEH